ncbi:MAG: hypothetical protein LBS91_03360 [Clostridiales Family XIII bacterium]|nr:hypothetical protein [Clostridiales Family XIII bacterium]
MKDYEYFKTNLAQLFDAYGHSFVVIKNLAVLGSYDTFEKAYTETVKTEPPGTFIIQECVENPEELMQTFQGNVAFAQHDLAV